MLGAASAILLKDLHSLLFYQPCATLSAFENVMIEDI